MFVGDDQQPRAAGLFDLGPFGSVDQTLDRAVDDDILQLQRLDHGAVALNGPRGAGGFDGNRGRLRRGRHLDHEELSAKVIGGQFAQLDQDRAGLRFVDDRKLGAFTDPIQGKDAPERGQPFAFDAFLQHALPFVLDGRV